MQTYRNGFCVARAYAQALTETCFELYQRMSRPVILLVLQCFLLPHKRNKLCHLHAHLHSLHTALVASAHTA
jgi:hypothetical protein